MYPILSFILTCFYYILALRVKTLWTPLRAQYMKYRRRLLLPTGSAGNRRPYFRHTEAMQFLVDSIEPNEGWVFFKIISDKWCQFFVFGNRSISNVEFLDEDEFQFQLVGEGTESQSQGQTQSSGTLPSNDSQNGQTPTPSTSTATNVTLVVSRSNPQENGRVREKYNGKVSLRISKYAPIFLIFLL